MGHYENLAGGLFAANAALFAGWLAWSAVQIQISAEEARAAADRVEIESVLQNDLDWLAEGLSSIWKILEPHQSDLSTAMPTEKLEGVIYGIGEITKDIPTFRAMVASLGWERRRQYDRWLDGLERLQNFRANFNVQDAYLAVWDVGVYCVILRPETIEYFGEELWRRSPKAWTLGYRIAFQAGVAENYYEENAADAVVEPTPGSLHPNA